MGLIYRSQTHFSLFPVNKKTAPTGLKDDLMTGSRRRRLCLHFFSGSGIPSLSQILLDISQSPFVFHVPSRRHLGLRVPRGRCVSDSRRNGGPTPSGTVVEVVDRETRTRRASREPPFVTRAKLATCSPRVGASCGPRTDPSSLAIIYLAQTHLHPQFRLSASRTHSFLWAILPTNPTQIGRNPASVQQRS